MRNSPVRTVGPVVLLLVGPVVDAGAAGARTCRVDPSESRIDVKVGTAGIFRFAGHEHGVSVPVAHGEVVAAPEDIGASSVDLAFATAAIRVSSSKGPASDIPKVQEKMAGPSVLDVIRFPEARFRSRRVGGKPAGSAGLFDIALEGELTVRGTSRPVSAQVQVALQDQRLVATGRASIRQTDFGIDPVSVAGVVKVKNELALEVRIVAHCAE